MGTSFSLASYAAFLDTLGECACLVGPDGRVAAVNVAARRLGHAVGDVLPAWWSRRDLVTLDGVAYTLARDPQWLADALHVGQVGIFDHDHATGLIEASPVTRAIYGWTDDQEITLDTIMACAHPDDGPRVGAAVARAHDPSGDGLCDVEGRLFHTSGEVRWVRTRSHTTFVDGRPDRTVGAIVDVTDLHLREVRLGRFAAVLDATPDVVLLVDPSGGRLYQNAAAEGAGWPDRAPPAFHDAVRAARAKGRWTGELAVELPELGSRNHVWVVLRHGEGEGAFVSAVGRDLTETERLEQQLVQARRLEAVGRLAGGVAHDFNNVLSVIIGTVDLLLDEVGPRSAADLKQVRFAAERAADLVRQMLAFGRKQVLRPIPVDVGEVVQSLMPILRRLVRDDVTLAVDVAPTLPRVLADPTQLEQVLLNLVANASDAMPDGGTVHLELSVADLDEAYAADHLDVRPGRHLLLAVSDEGVGMDEPTLARIFEPFFTTKAVGKGTGLGLATTFGVVKQSGGHIWVYSEPGRGTTFKVYLPATDAEPSPAHAEPAPPPEVRGLILLVEDDPAVRKVVARVLRRGGHEVEAPEGSAAALEVGLSRPFDLVVTDVVMPGLSGPELARRLEARWPGQKVLYLTGYTENGIVHRGVVDPGVELLQKPVVPKVLLETVARLLAGG